MSKAKRDNSGSEARRPGERTTEEVLADIQEFDDEILLADGFEDAVIGIVDRACARPVACYDYDRCVEILIKRDGMSAEQAVEYIDFNVTGAYVGELTPAFLHNFRRTK